MNDEKVAGSRGDGRWCAAVLRVVLVAVCGFAATGSRGAAGIQIKVDATVSSGVVGEWEARPEMDAGGAYAAGLVEGDAVVAGAFALDGTASRVWVERRTVSGALVWFDQFDLPRAPRPLGDTGKLIPMMAPSVAVVDGFIHLVAEGGLHTYSANGARVRTGQPSEFTRVFASAEQLYVGQAGGPGSSDRICAQTVAQLTSDGGREVWSGEVASSPSCGRFCGLDFEGNLLSVNVHSGPSFSAYCTRRSGEGRWQMTWPGVALARRCPVEIVPLDDLGFALIGGAQPHEQTDRSVSYGGRDVWLGWLDANGRRRGEQTYGGTGDEEAVGAHRAPGGGLVLVSITAGSGVSGRKTVAGDGVWVLALDRNWEVARELVIPDWRPVATTSDQSGVLVLAFKEGRLRVQRFPFVPRFRVSGLATSTEAFDVDSSPDLLNWSPVARSIRGRFELEEEATDGQRFFRVTGH